MRKQLIRERKKLMKTINSNPKNYICCICNCEFTGYGNNPQPISQNPKDRCCDNCNQTVVIPERIKRLLAGLSARG